MELAADLPGGQGWARKRQNSWRSHWVSNILRASGLQNISLALDANAVSFDLLIVEQPGALASQAAVEGAQCPLQLASGLANTARYLITASPIFQHSSISVALLLHAA